MTHPCDLYTELRQLYDTCNRALFGGSLPPCMIVLRPKRRAVRGTHLVCGACNEEMAMAPEQLALVNGV